MAVDTTLHVEWNEVKSLPALSPLGHTRTSLVRRLVRQSSVDSQDSLEVPFFIALLLGLQQAACAGSVAGAVALPGIKPKAGLAGACGNGEGGQWGKQTSAKVTLADWCFSFRV